MVCYMARGDKVAGGIKVAQQLTLIPGSFGWAQCHQSPVFWVWEEEAEGQSQRLEVVKAKGGIRSPGIRVALGCWDRFPERLWRTQPCF